MNYPEIPDSSRIMKLKKQLQIENITSETFINILEEQLLILNNRMKHFLDTKDNKWFLNFYELMFVIEDKHDYLESDLFLQRASRL